MPSQQYSVKVQQEIFSNFWEKFSQQVKNNEGSVDFPTGTDLKPHHITTIVRLPAHIANKLAEEVKSISTDDYHYPSSDIHLTLINLDRLLGNQGQINWLRLKKLITEEMNPLPHLSFTVRGINIFPTTVFAEIYDENGTLEAYREAILRAVRTYLSADFNLSDHAALVPGITFANLIRFKNRPSATIVEAIKDRREIDFGAFEPREFEFVTTNKLLSVDGTIVNSVVPISKARF